MPEDLVSNYQSWFLLQYYGKANATYTVQDGVPQIQCSVCQGKLNFYRNFWKFFSAMRG